MEELKKKHREYYWSYGKSRFKKDENLVEESDALVFESQCSASSYRRRAMASARFCHTHIVQDPKQVLYKACNVPIRSGEICKRPVLKSAVPPLCSLHAPMAEKYLQRALEKAGLNIYSPSIVSPKLHVLVVEFVRQRQIKRRAAQKASTAHIESEEEGAC